MSMMSGLEVEGRNVDGQGSDSEKEEKIEVDNLFSVSTIRDKEQERKRAKEHEQEMGYDEVPRNISNAEMRRKALKFMEKDVVREIISEHMAELNEARASDEIGKGKGEPLIQREKKGKGLRGFGEDMPLTQMQISQHRGSRRQTLW